jgi:hypothetical protein
VIQLAGTHRPAGTVVHGGLPRDPPLSALCGPKEGRLASFAKPGTMRSLLVFKGADGNIEAEVLGRRYEFAELVDPDDGSVRHTEPFSMNGAEWMIESVAATEDLIRVICVPAAESRRALTDSATRSTSNGRTPSTP